MIDTTRPNDGAPRRYRGRMDLYVCWTQKQLPVPRRHPCTTAHEALVAAGHDPNVILARSYGALPDALQTKARKHVKEKTGSTWVPALETDEGEWISGSDAIASWAAEHPARG